MVNFGQYKWASVLSSARLIRYALSCIVLVAGSCLSPAFLALGADNVEHVYVDTTTAKQNAYTNEGGGYHNAGASNGTSSGSRTDYAGYTIHNGKLYVVRMTQSTYVSGNTGPPNYDTTYEWNGPTFTWVEANAAATGTARDANGWVAGGGNVANIMTSDGTSSAYHGDATGSGNGISGGSNTVNINGAGTVNGTLNTYTGGNGNSTLNLGQGPGPANNTGGSIASGGTVNINWGTVTIGNDSQHHGTIYAGNTTNATNVTQSGTSIVDGAVTVNGTGSSYRLQGGNITSATGNITYAGDGSSFLQTGGNVQSNAQVNYSGDTSTYTQNAGNVQSGADINYSGAASSYTLNNGSITGTGNILNETTVNYTNTTGSSSSYTSFIQTGGTVTAGAQVNYDGLYSRYTMTGGTISAGAAVHYTGDNARFVMDDANGNSLITGATTTITYDGESSGLWMSGAHSGLNSSIFDSGTMTFNGANSIGVQTGGNITGNAIVNYNGGGAYYELYGDATDNGLIDGNAQVNFYKGGNTFDQYGGITPGTSAGVVDENATITITRDTTNDSNLNLTTHDKENLYLLHENAYIGTVANTTLTSHPTINMTNGRATFDQFDNSSVNGYSEITLSGVYNPQTGVDGNGNPVYTRTRNYYHQHDSATVNNNVKITMNDGYGRYELEDTAKINNNVQVIQNGGSTWFEQHDQSEVNNDVNITQNGGYGHYEQYGTSKVNNDVKITQNGSHGHYEQYGGSSINDQAEITQNGGTNHYEQYGTSSINNTVTVKMNGGSNFYEQYGSSTIGGTTLTNTNTGATITVGVDNTTHNNSYYQYGQSAVQSDTIVTLHGNNSLYRLYQNSDIKDTAEVNLITGNNNRFHMFANETTKYSANDPYNIAYKPEIKDNATININQANSNSNYFLMEAGHISSVGAAGGNAINMNGSGTRMNVFSQTGGRVSTATIGSSNINGANINLNGANSHQNIFELTGTNPNDRSFNDYAVFIGSNDTVTPGNNTSTQGIYHQSGGRKNADVTITGSKNLFWLNEQADYSANSYINSGAGANSGNNLVVVDIDSHALPADPALALDDTTRAAAAYGNLDMRRTTTGENHMYLANGDMYGNITTSGTATAETSDSSTTVYIGYTQDKNAAVNNHGLSWYKTENYNLTGLAPSVIENVPGVGEPGYDPDRGPVDGPYFSVINQVNETDHLNVKQLHGGGGEMHVKQAAGNAYNIKADVTIPTDTQIDNIRQNTTFAAMYPFGYTYDGVGNNYGYSNIYQHPSLEAGQLPSYYSDYEYTHDYFNDGDYITYSILNEDVVNVGAYVDQGKLYHSPTSVTIGAIKDSPYQNDYKSINLNSQYDPLNPTATYDALMPGMQDNHTAHYYENKDADGNALLTDNYGPHSYRDEYDGHQAQITAGVVNVYAGSKLTVHPNFLTTTGVFDSDDATDDRRNVIGNLNLIGNPITPLNCNDCGYSTDSKYRAIATIDRTTIHTIADAATTITRYADKAAAGGYTLYGDYKANVVVGTNGVLQGWSDFSTNASADDHSPNAANIIGDVAVLSGGMIRPYDGAIQYTQYEANALKEKDPTSTIKAGDLKEGIFVVHGNALSHNNGYSPDFEANAQKLKGVVMKLDGNTTFESASIVSTRLFAEAETGNTLNVLSDGEDTDINNYNNNNYVFTPRGDKTEVQKYWGDAIEVTGQTQGKVDIKFDEIAYSSVYLKGGVRNPYTPAELAAGVSSSGERIDELYKTAYTNSSDRTTMKKLWEGVAQHYKVQYVPVFGFVNELKTKLDFNIYQGGDQSGVTSYYYQVLYGDDMTVNAIRALDGMDDANHIFNRDILFSDMLGNWSFLKEDGDKGVVLRYRQLAKHVQDGGIAIDQKLRNSKEVALKLDEIRYPFSTKYTDSAIKDLFGPDPSLDGNMAPDGTATDYETPYDYDTDTSSANDDPYYAYDGNPYDVSGFDGDIETFYRNAHENEPGKFGNYRDVWVHDISNYLHALQLNVGSVDEIHRSLRLLSAEAYASQANADLMSMNMFINSRERNSVSAMYMVEEKRERKPEPDPENLYGQFIDPIAEDMPVAFVNNPVRFWTAAIGYRTSQDRKGDEYGYDTKSHGMQIGMIREKGDLYYGLTGAYTSTTNTWDQLQARNKSDNYMGEALLGIRRDWGFLEGHLNYGYMEHKMKRDLTQGADLNNGEYDPALDCDLTDNYYNGVYRASHTGDYENLVRGGGIRIGVQQVFWEKWLFLPTLGVRFMDIRNKHDFTETGKDIDAFRIVFDNGKIKRKSLQVPLMMRLSRGIAFNNGGPTILTPEFRFGATVECLDRAGRVNNYKWIGNPIPDRYMKAWGVKEDRISYQAGTTLELSRHGRFYAALNYDFFWGNGFGHQFSFQSGLNF